MLTCAYRISIETNLDRKILKFLKSTKTLQLLGLQSKIMLPSFYNHQISTQKHCRKKEIYFIEQWSLPIHNTNATYILTRRRTDQHTSPHLKGLTLLACSSALSCLILCSSLSSSAVSSSSLAKEKYTCTLNGSSQASGIAWKPQSTSIPVIVVIIISILQVRVRNKTVMWTGEYVYFERMAMLYEIWYPFHWEMHHL